MKLFVLLIPIIFVFIGCQDYADESLKNPYNEKEKGERLRTIKVVENSIHSKAVVENDKLWNVGDTIKIKFLNGSSGIQEKVKLYASNWLQYANLKFEYVQENADVKIGFDIDVREIAWSTIGKDCQLIPQNEPSLNFVGLEEEQSEDLIRGEVLKGFGHILGLGFEHRSPVSPINLNNAKTRNYFMFLCGLTEEDVNNDILPIYNASHTNYSEFDEKSIMILELPLTIQDSPKKSLAANTVLSEMDKKFIAKLYPYEEKPIITLELTNSNVNFTIEANNSVVIDWGDGCKETDIFSHQYDDLQSHIIKFYADSTAIVKFTCDFSNLKSLDISGCTAMTYLMCKGNQLTSLDISKNIALVELNCESNQITKLDISNNTNLISLLCRDNRIVELKLNSTLKVLSCCINCLKQLDLSNCESLTHLECEENQLQQLDLSNCKEITILYCSQNPLSSLDLSYNTKLKHLMCGYCPLVTLKVNNNPQLEEISCVSCSLTSLSFPKSRNLISLDCWDCQLTELDITACPNLSSIRIWNNKLTTMNLSNNKQLSSLWCYNNRLTSLNLSANLMLGNLDCSNNLLSYLDIRVNNSLAVLQCGNNLLTSLQANSSLKVVECYDNPFITDEANMLAFINTLPLVTTSLGKLTIHNFELTKKYANICAEKGWIIDDYWDF